VFSTDGVPFFIAARDQVLVVNRTGRSTKNQISAAAACPAPHIPHFNPGNPAKLAREAARRRLNNKPNEH
jgi:hypothetical protein